MLQLLQLAQAMQIVMETETEFTPDSFVELTDEMYASLHRQGGDPSVKYYRVVTMEPGTTEGGRLELSIVSERERRRLLDAVQIVYRMSDESKKRFETFQERLDYVRNILPPGIV
jgi:hypothetical protein